MPNALIVLDRSGSMGATSGTTTKWAAATNAVNSLTTTFAGQLHFGLMLFPGTQSICDTGTLSVGIAASTQANIASAMASTYPQNNTPLGATLTNALTYLQGLGSSKPRYVIVITDGEETCGGDPVAAATSLANAGIKTYVIGFGSGVNPTTLSAVANAGQTTNYFQADNLAQLTSALNQIAGQLSCCGNGILDSGELCDSTIPANTTGACPQGCNDNDPCTKDTLNGLACQAQCSHTPITIAKNGDGCCPAGETNLTDSDCKPACGNGVVEQGERCDTAIPAGTSGACPQSCDDGNVCTRDTRVGSGCIRYCINVPITQPKDGDGCCPPGASSATDKDCPAQCGNGIVDPGETCDTKIPAGQKGACPTVADCKDNDPCTRDVLDAAPCKARCRNIAITTNKDNDGCCLPGATSIDDNDCKPVCGNGVLEQGEQCDTKIPAGKQGACPTSCDGGQDKCIGGTLIGSGCQRTCTKHPKKADPNTKDGCCPEGASLSQDADCLPPCTPDRTTNCVDVCKNVKCPDGHYCKMGKCAPWPKNAGGGAGGAGGTEGPGDPNDPNGQGAGNEPGFQAAPGGCECKAGGGAGSVASGAVWLLCLALVWGFARRRRRG